MLTVFALAFHQETLNVPKETLVILLLAHNVLTLTNSTQAIARRL